MILTKDAFGAYVQPSPLEQQTKSVSSGCIFPDRPLQHFSWSLPFAVVPSGQQASSASSPGASSDDDGCVEASLGMKIW